MITAAALCPAAPLLARELTGADPVVPELRRACLDAVVSLVASAPDLVAVVGAGTQTRDWPDVAGLDLSAYAPSLGRVPGNTASVPLPLGLAAQLLDQAGYAGRRTLHTASESASLDECMALGKRLADLADDVGLLVIWTIAARHLTPWLNLRCDPVRLPRYWPSLRFSDARAWSPAGQARHF